MEEKKKSPLALTDGPACYILSSFNDACNCRYYSLQQGMEEGTANRILGRFSEIRLTASVMDSTAALYPTFAHTRPAAGPSKLLVLTLNSRDP